LATAGELTAAVGSGGFPAVGKSRRRLSIPRKPLPLPLYGRQYFLSKVVALSRLLQLRFVDANLSHEHAVVGIRLRPHF
jgi:hypothetical protein